MKYIINCFDIVWTFICFLYKKMFHRQLYIFISTPCFGNVGDHAIFLAEKQLLAEAALKNRIFEFTYFEYKHLYKHIHIRKQDVVLIDGGGNFGDTWPETLTNFLSIITRYKNNRILIFPESWYFSNTDSGRFFLNETIKAFEENPNIVIFARDTWSFNEMKKYLESSDVRFAYDCVLYKNISYLSFDVKQEKSNYVIGLSLRNDKEKFTNFSGSLNQLLKSKSLKLVSINNDSQHLVSKNKRKKYFEQMIKLYNSCDLIITDRFHGYVLSILCDKPCIAFDNITGKVKHSFNDLNSFVSNCYCYDTKKLPEDIYEHVVDCLGKASRTAYLEQELNNKKEIIINALKEWREQE